MYVSSEVADAIDYYFFYGPDLDKVVADYRELTGAAPMFGKWAYGFWQCKNRYRSQEEILGVAHKYRELHIRRRHRAGLVLVESKGEFIFNKNYPIRRHGRWPAQRPFPPDDLRMAFFEPGSKEYEYMSQQGWFIERFKFAKPPYHTDEWLCTTPPIPKPGNIIGI